MKRPPTEWEKIFANYISDKGLMSKLYKEVIQLSITETKIWFKNGHRIWIDIFLKTDGQQAHEKLVNITGHQGKASKPQWDNTSHPSEWLLSKRQHITSVGKCEEKGTLVQHCWWEYKLVQALWKTVWRLLKKNLNRTTIWSSNSTPDYLSKETENTD